MRILLDECMPDLLKKDIIGHNVATVTQMGWSGTKNGRLLSVAETELDILLTVNRSIEYQQNMQGRRISVVILHARSKLPLLPL